MSINWGFISTGLKYQNRQIDKSVKILNQGYRIKFIEEGNKTRVDFPYLNNDYFEGKILDPNDSKSKKYGMMFLKGQYHLNNKTSRDLVIDVKNLHSIFDIEQV